MNHLAMVLALAGCDSVLGLGETTFTSIDAIDAAPDACDGPQCHPSFASCRALKMMYPSAPSGVYTIADGAIDTFRAYCDQTGDSGGWTLAMKIDGRLTTFEYDSPMWENAELLGEAAPDLDKTEAKLQTFNALAFTEVRIGLEYPIDSGEVRYLVVPLVATKMSELFTPSQMRMTMLGRDAWKSLMGTAASLQLNCNMEGTNQYHEYTRIRLGILANQEEDCGTPDSRIGVGGGGIVCGSPTPSAGNVACYDPDNGEVTLPAFGWVFVR